jgi:hypothetical protein
MTGMTVSFAIDGMAIVLAIVLALDHSFSLLILLPVQFVDRGVESAPLG